MAHALQICLLILSSALLLSNACKSGERSGSLAGADLYLRYCASCHGADGKGGGPVASTLRAAPADLTRIAKRTGGFDQAAVLAAIDGRRSVAAHGPREMPVWGAVFVDELKDEPYPQYVSLLHSRALMEYLRSIQE